MPDRVEDPREAFESEGQPGTDPNERDTDRDGYADLLEIGGGYDPTDPSSQPPLNVLDGLIGGDLTDPEDDGLNDPEITFEFQDDPSGPAEGIHLDLFDNQVNSDWFSLSPTGGGGGPLFLWVEASFPQPIVLDHFTVTSGSGDAADDPRGWEIQGSNDGTNFDTIFHRTNPDEPVWTGRGQVVRFDADVHYTKPAAYKTIRFSNHLHREWRLVETFRLGELEFFGTPYHFEITGFQRLDQDRVQIEWASLPGSSTYSIDVSSDLEVWNQIDDDVPSQGGTTSYIAHVSGASASGRVFVRVRQNP